MKFDWKKYGEYSVGIMMGMGMMKFIGYHWSGIIILPLFIYLFLTLWDAMEIPKENKK